MRARNYGIVHRGSMELASWCLQYSTGVYNATSDRVSYTMQLVSLSTMDLALGCLQCSSRGVYNALSMQNLQTWRSGLLVVYSSKYLLIVHSQPHTYTQVANSFLLYSQTFFSQSLVHLRFVRKNIQYLC